MWIIFYADGSTFSSDDGPPYFAPRIDVVAIVVPDAHVGRVIHNGSDFYIWDTLTFEGETIEGWLGVDRWGLDDYLDRPGVEKIRLKGRQLPASVFWEIYGRAERDERLAPKSSLEGLEQRRGRRK